MFDWATKFIRDTKWEVVIADIKDIAAAAKMVADAVLTIASNWDKVRTAIDLASGPMGLAKIVYRAYSGAPSAPAQPAAGAAPQGLMGQPFMRKGGKVSANDVKVGGAIHLQIDAKPGFSVRTASLSSDNRNVPLQVNLGRTMAAPA